MNNEHQIDALNLQDLLRRFWRQKFLIMLVVMSSLVGSFFYYKSLPKMYSVTSKIIYESSNRSQSASMGALAAIAGMSMGGGDADASTYLLDIICSKDFLNTILAKKWKVEALPLWLSKSITIDTTTEKPLDFWWQYQVDTSVNNWKYIKELDLLTKLQQTRKPYISIDKDPRSPILTLTTQFEDSRLSYDIHVHILDTLNERIISRNTKKASRNRAFMEKRLAEFKADLDNAEANLVNFRERNIQRQSPNIQNNEDRLRRRLAISQEMFVQMQKQFEAARIEEMKDSPVIEVISQPMKPVYPSSPNKVHIMVIGFLLGLFLACTMAVLIDLVQCNRKAIIAFIKS